MICLATPRLLLRTWRVEDGPDLLRLVPGDAPTDGLLLFNSSARSVLDADEPAASGLERFERSWATDGFGIFALESFESGSVIGLAGVQTRPTPDATLDLVWRTRSTDDHGADTLAVEALTAVIDWTFGLHDITTLGAEVLLGDLAASSVVESVGMSLQGRTLDPSTSTWVDRYELTLGTWNADLL